MSDPVKLTRSMALDGQSILHDGLTIQPKTGMGKIMIQRSNAVSDDDMKGLATTLGLSIPLSPCEKTINSDNDITILCIEPTMWIIICDDNKGAKLAHDIEKAAGKKTIIVTPVTDQYHCLDLKGQHARSLLAKGCVLNLADNIFSETHTARTLLAQANVIIWRSNKDDFRLIFDVSLGNYLWCWITSAALEFSDNSLFIERN